MVIALVKLIYKSICRLIEVFNKLNQNTTWRKIYGKPEDGKFKDVEKLSAAKQLMQSFSF